MRHAKLVLVLLLISAAAAAGILVASDDSDAISNATVGESYSASGRVNSSYYSDTGITTFGKVTMSTSSTQLGLTFSATGGIQEIPTASGSNDRAYISYTISGTPTSSGTATFSGTYTYSNTVNGSRTDSFSVSVTVDPAAHTHSYTSKVTKSATCTSTGVRTYTCSCGDSYTETIAKSSHSYKSKVTKAATCDSTGVRTYTCSVCSDSYTSTIAKTSHIYDLHSAKAATCTEDGNSEYYTCTICSAVFNSSKVKIAAVPTISALGHSWGSWSTTKAATCESTGTQSHTCSRCSTTATQTIAATGHTYVSHAAKASTCTEQGWSTYYSCSGCTKVFNTSKTAISAIPYLALKAHTYTTHSAKAATCTAAGNPLYYSCSACSGLFDSSKALISAAPTTAALGHSYTAKTYTWSTDCSGCTVGLECSRDSSHTSSISAVSTSTVTRNSDVLTTTIYKVSGTDPFTSTSYSATKTHYTHTAILRYDLSGGSGSFPDQTASFTSESASPFGSKSLTIPSTKPSKSGEVFFGWAKTSSGTVAYSAGSSVPVSYGSITTLYAMFEPTLAWTSVPTASCVVMAVYTYADDGSYTLKSKALASSVGIASVADTPSCPDADVLSDVQHPGILGSPVREEDSSIDGYSPLNGGPGLLPGDQAVLGASSDPAYRTPPAADHVIGITDDLSFRSNDPAYTIRWSLTDASGADSEEARMFAVMIGLAKSGFAGSTYSYTADECLPSWITWDATATTMENGTFTLVIRPALQQVAEDTHGSYWIWFSIADGNSALGKTRTTTYLVQFNVSVQWAGGVIVPSSYAVFLLHLDYGFDGGVHNSTLSSGQVPRDTEEYRFPVDTGGVSRDGYLYKGWSMSAGSSSTDVGEEFPLHVRSAATRATEDGNGNIVYEGTLYAVWEETGEDGGDGIVLPDSLRDLLSLLSDPYVMILFMASVFGIAVIVRVRRQGMVRCGR